MVTLSKLADISNLTANFTSLTGPKELFGMLFILFIFLYGMSIGRTRALLSLLSIYVALTLTNLFPYFDTVTDAVSNFEPYLLKAGLFFVLYIGAFFALHNSSLKRLSMGGISLPKVMIISALQIGFIGAVIASFIPTATAVETLGSGYIIIGSPLALFIWSLGSLAILPLMRENR